MQLSRERLESGCISMRGCAVSGGGSAVKEEEVEEEREMWWRVKEAFSYAMKRLQ